MTGLAGNDTLDGAGGADAMVGGAGNDTYYVDDSADTVDERGGSGTDTVLASVDYALYVLNDANNALKAGVEHLTLTGDTAIKATGNALANRLTGNAGNNTLTGLAGNDTLDGSSGADTLRGGLGNDTYVVDNLADVIEESATEGTDTVQSSVSHTLSENVENLVLTGLGAINATGNTGNNTLTGNAGNNVLDGGAGGDRMLGGSGDDTYVVDHLMDVVTEGVNGGADLVLVSTTSANGTYTLGANVEHATLRNTVNYNLTGNTLANTLTGNAYANVLNGGGGADRLVGGAGDDTYLVDHAEDVITEAYNEGTDLVQVRITTANGIYTLGDNVEHAILSNTVSFSLTGNALDNTLTGNAAANEIRGSYGADVLLGGAGNDTLNGGDGADTLTGGTGVDSLTGGEGSDTFVFAAKDSGNTAATLDKITDFAKGAVGTGDLIDYSAVLSIGGSALAATASQASISQTTGIASFATGSGTTLSDALGDVAGRFTAAGNSAGEFAFFKVNGAGSYYLFVSDGVAGVGAGDVVVELVGVSSIAGIDLTGGNLSLLIA